MPALALIFKKAVCVGVFSLGVLSLPLRASAVPIEAVPNPRQNNGGWVTDMANILDSNTEAEINRLVSELEAQYGSEIAVVTVPDTAPSATPKEFTTALFNHWGIGKKGEDNGVLFLISHGDRRVEIETGYGVESILPDARVGNIIEREITPRFKQGDFNGGTLAGTQALVVALRGEEATAIARRPIVTLYIYAVGGIGAVLAFATSACAKKRRVFLTPEGQTRKSDADEHKRKFHCAECKKSMKKLNETELQSYLRKPQQVAQHLGSVNVEAWQCPDCYPKLTGSGIHLFTRVLNSSDFSTCPTCQELTAKRTIEQVLEAPTWNKEGEQLTKLDCQCCSHQEQVKETIPCLVPPIEAVFISPTGRSRVRYKMGRIATQTERATHCQECQYPMEKLDPSILLPHLSRPEQVAQEIGSVTFIAWQCPHCIRQQTDLGIHIRAYVPRLPSSSSRSSSSSSSSSCSSSSSSDFGGGSSGGGGAGGSW